MAWAKCQGRIAVVSPLSRAALGNIMRQLTPVTTSVVGTFAFIRQPAQPIKGTVQHLGEGDQGGNRRPSLAVLDGMQALGADSYVGRQLARGPIFILSALADAFSQNYFYGIHFSPLDRQLLTYV